MSTSIFDLFGRAKLLRSAGEIDAQIHEDRAAWGETITGAGKRGEVHRSDVLWLLGNHLRQCLADHGVLIASDEKIVLKYGDGPPILVTEVFSPNASIGKLMERVTDQLRRGTKLVWVIDLDARSVIVYPAGKQPYVVRHDQELTGDDVLPDFRCRVAEFFTMPGQDQG